jgi:hypothetical protein
MTEFEKLEFLDHWLTEVGPTLRELRTAIQRLCNRLNWEMDAGDNRSDAYFGHTDCDLSGS